MPSRLGSSVRHYLAGGLRRRAAGAAAVATLVLLFAGCAANIGALQEAGIPGRARVEGVPAVEQAREDHCGPAALSALLAWSGHEVSPQALAPLVFLPGRSGTLPVDLSREVRARGLLAYRPAADLGALLNEVAAGHPSVVLEKRGFGPAPVWHYSVLAGYDLDERTALLYAGAAFPEEVRLGAFARTWSRGGSFALLALPPGELPAADDPSGILTALADLEETGQAASAVGGYEAFLRRWPADWRGAFGWGNALYALGDRARADEAFRRAHGTAPDRPEPLNNLALLALADGRRQAAEALARMAVENGMKLGIDPEPYADTLREVKEVRSSAPLENRP